MPSVQPPALVLVTGANGYIATWVVYNLLHKGFSVRATVRSAEKGKHFAEQTWSKPFVDQGKLEVVVVSDITKDDAFDDAVKGVDAIEHTASPFHFNAVEPQELIGPAVNGTLNILQSALKYGSSVKRVVITGSCASILEILPVPKSFSELDWNEQSIKEVEEQGSKASAASKYRASKILAERAAWEWFEKHKSQIGWDLVVLNPPYVFGPPLHPVASPKDLGTSAADFHNTILVPGSKSNEVLRSQSSSFIDVRDLGEGHARALLKDGIGGERIIISTAPFTWQEWLDVANSLTPSPIPSHPVLAKGAPYGESDQPIHFVVYNTAKAARLLHIGPGEAPEGVTDWYQSKSMKELAREVLEDAEKRGW
ncbi:NAD(P)-binding protein [Pluteus cervinus]|uniref:NAD(P)-binding protein n=1 Tax=Pluteus cervinus TaxID=181527 RepID=A0ACD3ABL3_9AGAR|nr:NAD(P)-binding protein [Pluteus cervinus]